MDKIPICKEEKPTVFDWSPWNQITAEVRCSFPSVLVVQIRFGNVAISQLKLDSGCPSSKRPLPDLRTDVSIILN